MQIVNPQAIELDIGITVYPNPVRLNVIELNVLAKSTIVSKDFKIVVTVSFFFISFVNYDFFLRSK